MWTERLGPYVRERVPDAVLHHFILIPWPAPRPWLLLPEAMRLPIVRSLCQNDIVGFQTERDAQNFWLGSQVTDLLGVLESP